MYDDSPITDSDAEDEESENEIDNVSVTIISSDESGDNVQPISYLSKDKKYKWSENIPENIISSKRPHFVVVTTFLFQGKHDTEIYLA